LVCTTSDASLNSTSSTRRVAGSVCGVQAATEVRLHGLAITSGLVFSERQGESCNFNRAERLGKTWNTNPEAAELVALKDHGVSTELLMALLPRGDELRLRLAIGLLAVSPYQRIPPLRACARALLRPQRWAHEFSCRAFWWLAGFWPFGRAVGR
jgi:hypothetical protein